MGTVYLENKTWSPIHDSRNQAGEAESQFKLYSDELANHESGKHKGIFLIAPETIEEKYLQRNVKIELAKSITWHRISVWQRAYIKNNKSSPIFTKLASEFTSFLKERGIIMSENFNISEINAASHVIPLLNKCWGVLEKIHGHIENELNIGNSQNSFGPWINDGRLAGEHRFAVYGESNSGKYNIRIFAGFFFDRFNFLPSTDTREDRKDSDIIPTLRVIVSFDPKFTDNFTPLIDAIKTFQDKNPDWVIRKGNWYYLSVEKLMTDFLKTDEQQPDMIEFFKKRLNEIRYTKIGAKNRLLDYIGEKGKISE